MRNWTKPLTLCLSLLAISVQAARTLDFETDAFNRAYPLSLARSAVFSPLSFELDCVVVAEALPTIPKANVAERLGITSGLAEAFVPILEAYEKGTAGGLGFVTARGFCVPDIEQTLPQARRYLQRTYSAEVMRTFPPQGAESWFRTTMEGEMEGFAIPSTVYKSQRYAYYGLVSVEAAWRDAFPKANSRQIKFRVSPGAEPQSVSAISDVREADVWETKTRTVLRLPLKGDAWFFAILPQGRDTLHDLRQELTASEIVRLLKGMDSVTEPGISHGPCVVVLPKLDLRSRYDTLPMLEYFQIPSKGLPGISNDVPAREYVQHVRFRLAENGSWEKPLVKKDAKDVVPVTASTKNLIFNRPFLFFVYHEPTETIPVAGQFCGN